jgi:NTE family protein
MIEAPKAAETSDPISIGLVLPGGGARAAYQVGVVRAISDLMPARSPNPFAVIAGTSAGAINATALAIHAERFRLAAVNLERVWRNFAVNQVFRADFVSMMRGSLHWFLAMVSGGWLLPPPKSLFDNHPLRELLHANFDLDGIGRSITSGHLKALAIAAAGYSTARSVSFFEGTEECRSWYRVRRCGEATKISLDHLMASVAVPFLFPPVVMGDEYFGDGAMRQATPFSSAIHLGADRLLVVGTRNEVRTERRKIPRSPSFGQIFGFMLDALFSDGLYSDLERLNQINDLLRHTGPLRTPNGTLRMVDLLVILPSEDISVIARKHTDALPRSLRVLLRTMGAMNTGGGELMSYLMFESRFTRELIALGYKDAMERSGEIVAFLGGDHVQSSGATMAMRRLQARS